MKERVYIAKAIEFFKKVDIPLLKDFNFVKNGYHKTLINCLMVTNVTAEMIIVD